MRKFLQKIFSVKNEDYYTEIKFLNKTFRHIKSKRAAEKLKEYSIKIENMRFILERGINKEKISYDMENFNSMGVSDNPEIKSPRLIVSLTSFPDRMYDIHYAVYSLLNQTKKPDMLVLYLAEDEFKKKREELPQKLTALEKNGLTIKWCKDLKSYKKLVPALAEYPNDIIVTADDDIYYPADWLSKLYESYLKNPEHIHAHRCHKIKINDDVILPYNNWEKCINDNSADFLNFCTTGGGVLFPPKSLHSDVLKEELFLKLAPNADDIWFYSMAVLNNTKIKVTDNPNNEIRYVNPARELGFYDEKSLFLNGNNTDGNDIQLKNVAKHYPEVKENILASNRNYVFETYSKDIYSYILFLSHKFAYEYVRNFTDKNSSVLEIGPGDGYGTHYLSEYCGHIEGVDILEDVVNRANSKYKNEKCLFKLYDGKKLNYPEKSFDVVISFHCIEHVKNVKKYLNNIKRVLKSGGVCILTTPSRTYRLAKNQKPWNSEHLREYDSKILSKEISKTFNNFQILSVSAKQNILDIEFDRVITNRADFCGKRKNIDLDIDYKNEFSTADFYVSNKNLDSGIDLMAVCKKD